MHSELGNQEEDPVSFYLSDFFMAARPPPRQVPAVAASLRD